MNNIGYRLRKEREDLGMNRYQLSKVLNLGAQAVAAIENGHSNLTDSTITRIVEKFNWKDGDYADYYYGISQEEGQKLLKQATDKANRLDLNKREFYKAVGTSHHSWEKWQKELPPRGKRLLTKFIHTDDKLINKKIDTPVREVIDAEVAKENPMSGQELKKHRLRYDYSLAKLADKIGSDASSVSRWERGIASIPPHHIRKLYRIFDLEYYEVKRTFKSHEQREAERQERIRLMDILDGKTDNWTKLPANDKDFIAFQKVIGGKV